MRLVVLEPSGVRKRRAVGGAFLHAGEADVCRPPDAPGKTAGLPGAGAGQPVSTVDRLACLRALRDAVARNPLAEVTRADQALRAEGFQVVAAGDAQAAAAAVAAFAAPHARLVTNNSSAVKEIAPALRAAGLEALSGYPGRLLPGVSPAVTRGWQLPKQPAEVAGKAFVEHLPPPRLDGGSHPRRDLVALLGVSAVAGSSLFWVQHFENISRALQEAGRLVFLVPIDKLVPDVESARLQVDMAAVHGWAARLLDVPGLAVSAPAEDPWATAPITLEEPKVLVVLLDNGRSGLVDSPYAPLLRCISCRGCRKDCPTQRFFGGELGMSPVEYLRFYLLGLHDDLSLCVGCGNCSESCPVDIDIPGLIARVRHLRGAGHYVRDYFLLNPELVGRLGRPLMRGSSGGRQAGVLAELALGVHRDTRLPGFARRTFFDWVKARGAKTAGERVVLFSGCFVNYHDLEQGIATVNLLERAGFRVDVPWHRCCELPRLQGGFWSRAMGHIQANLETLERAVPGAKAVVTGCPSCARALTEFYPEVLGARAAWLRDSVRELFRFLRESGFSVGPVEGAEEGRRGEAPRRLLYHSPCHYPGVDPGRAVLGYLADLGVEVIEADRGCCGMAGSFGLKARQHDKAMDVGADLFARTQEDGYDGVVTNCGACKLQLQQATGRPVSHAAVVIDRTIRGGVA